MKWVQFLQDDTGVLSSYRLMFIAWGVVMLSLLSYLTITQSAFPKIDTSLVLLYGSVVGGKVAQAFAENLPNKPL